jgi:hypothetical protein
VTCLTNRFFYKGALHWGGVIGVVGRWLALQENARHRWDELRCGCGAGAAHIPVILRNLIDDQDPGGFGGESLEGHIEVEGNLFEAAVPAVSVILAALSGELSPSVRSYSLSLLALIVSGESHHTEVSHGRTHLGDECRYKVREGIWVILQGGAGKNREDVLDILSLVDLDDARRKYYADIFSA